VTELLALEHRDLADVIPLLSWPGLLYGYQRGWLGEEAVVRVAVDKLGGESPPAGEELALLLSDQHDRVPVLLARAAGVEHPGQPAQIDEDDLDLWIFLLLRKAYQMRLGVPDPLRLVEDLYEAFDHTPRLAPLIRYMPPPPGTSPVGEEGLMQRWRVMVDEQQEAFRRAAGS
jgi:hypothetical protein